jgi:hypothetical protein
MVLESKICEIPSRHSLADVRTIGHSSISPSGVQSIEQPREQEDTSGNNGQAGGNNRCCCQLTQCNIGATNSTNEMTETI